MQDVTCNDDCAPFPHRAGTRGKFMCKRDRFGNVEIIDMPGDGKIYPF